MRSLFRFTLIGAIALLGRSAGALVVMEPSPSRTIEWFVADSELIVRGVVRDVSEREVGRGNTFATVSLAVGDTYKGDPRGKTITFTARNSEARIWLMNGKQGGEYLFFLVRSANHVASRPGAAELAEGWNGAPYAMRDYYAVAPIPIRGEPDKRLYAFTGGIRDFETTQDVIDAIKEEVRRGSVEYRGEFGVLVSPHSEFLKRFPPRQAKEMLGLSYALHSLVIPLDRRAEAAARQWVTSADPVDRWNGVSVLAQFKSEQNAAALRGLLNDPFTSDGSWPRPRGGFELINEDRPGKWREERRPVRRFAWDTLKGWGLAAADAVIGKPVYAAAYPRTWALATPPAATAVLALWVLLRGGRRKRPRLLAGVGGVGFLLLIAAACLWARSHWRIDELAMRGGSGSRLELALMPGGVRVMSIKQWPDPLPVTLTSVPRSSKAQRDWIYHDGSAPVPGRSGRMGFYRDSGYLSGPGLGRGVAYTAWTAPYWAMVALFAIPVAWRGVRVVTAKRQRELGLCPTCGYDLRATPDRCPECGSTFTRPQRTSGSSLVAPIPA
jgi:hypothetical protein